MTLMIISSEAKALAKLKPGFLELENVQEAMFDSFQCFNTWQTNVYIAPEQLEQMTNDMVYYVTLAIVTDLFK